jgi:hypothetical protein
MCGALHECRDQTVTAAVTATAQHSGIARLLTPEISVVQMVKL